MYSEAASNAERRLWHNAQSLRFVSSEKAVICFVWADEKPFESIALQSRYGSIPEPYARGVELNISLRAICYETLEAYARIVWVVLEETICGSGLVLDVDR